MTRQGVLGSGSTPGVRVAPAAARTWVKVCQPTMPFPYGGGMTGTADRRFPRSVYRAGQEPDPRFSLANERTFLAWIRTALAFVAAGVALHALPIVMPAAVRFVAAVVLAGVGLLIPGTAWLGWVRTERALRTGSALPAPMVGPVVVAGTVAAGILVFVGVLLA